MKASVLISRVSRVLDGRAKIAQVGFVLFLLCLPLSAAADPGVIAGDGGGMADKQELTSLELQEKDYDMVFSESYTGNGIFQCNNTRHRVPSYLPYSAKRKDIFLTSSKAFCSSDFFKVIFGDDPRCDGTAPCVMGSFTSLKINGSVQESLLEKSLFLYAKKFHLNKNIYGYFLPSRCEFKCDDDQFVWFQGRSLHILSVPAGGGADDQERRMNELKESAASFLMQEEHDETR